MNDEGQDSKTIYSFAQIDFCSKYVSFALLELLSARSFVLLPFSQIAILKKFCSILHSVLVKLMFFHLTFIVTNVVTPVKMMGKSEGVEEKKGRLTIILKVNMFVGH